jgi:L-rhamnose isomerase
LEPVKLLLEAEKAGRNHERLILMEAFKTAVPFSAVWDKLNLEAGVPAGMDFLKQIDQYEKAVLADRL